MCAAAFFNALGVPDSKQLEIIATDEDGGQKTVTVGAQIQGLDNERGGLVGLELRVCSGVTSPRVWFRLLEGLPSRGAPTAAAL